MRSAGVSRFWSPIEEVSPILSPGADVFGADDELVSGVFRSEAAEPAFFASLYGAGTKWSNT